MNHADRSHPVPGTLQRFMRVELSRAEAAGVVRHLLTGCPSCVVLTGRLWRKEERPRALQALVEEMEALESGPREPPHSSVVLVRRVETPTGGGDAGSSHQSAHERTSGIKNPLEVWSQAMTEVEIASQKEVQQIVEELDAIQTRLETIRARLPVPADEPVMLEGEAEPDLSTEMRSVLECVLADNLRPAIRDLAAAASYQPNEKAPS